MPGKRRIAASGRDRQRIDRARSGAGADLAAGGAPHEAGEGSERLVAPRRSFGQAEDR